MDRQHAAAAYDLFTDLYDDYVGEFHDDLPFWRWITEAATAVVEIGCGTGRVMAALAAGAAKITGVDISTQMLAVAEKRLAAMVAAGRARLLAHDFASASLPQRFDAAIITFYTFNYVTEHPERFLGNVHDALRPGAVLAMDLFCPLPVQSPELNGVSRARSVTHDGHCIELADTRVMQTELELRTQVWHLPSGDRTIATRRRYYRAGEIDRLLSQAGFIDRNYAAGYQYRSLDRLERLPPADTNFIVTAGKPGRTSANMDPDR